MRRDDAYLLNTVEAVPAPMVKSIDEIVDPHPYPLPKGEGANSPLHSGKGVHTSSPLPSGKGGRRPGEGNEVMANQSISRSSETLRQGKWRDELVSAANKDNESCSPA